jgi:hypothetical protein
VELRGGTGGEAVAVAPLAAGGGGRRSGRRWMRGWSRFGVRGHAHLLLFSSLSPKGCSFLQEAGLLPATVPVGKLTVVTGDRKIALPSQ